MASYHELRFHAEGGESDGRGADADGHEQVVEFAQLRQKGTVRYIPRLSRLADVDPTSAKSKDPAIGYQKIA